jgi:Ran GTPase-activating protein (RanGAP) involved in mRNA processing and transport
MPRKAKKSKPAKSVPSSTVSRPDLHQNGMDQVAKALKADASLTILALRSIGVNDSVLAAHARAFSNYTCLSKLFLRSTKVSDVGMTALAQALKSNATVKVIDLDLGMNKVGIAGWTSFSQALARNTSVETLTIFDSLSDDGAVPVFAALKRNTTLTKLDLESNNVGQKGAAMLAEALECNTSLSTLNLSYNAIGDEGYTALLRVLKESNISLKNIELGSHWRASPMVDAIHKVVSANRAGIRLLHAQGEIDLTARMFRPAQILLEDLATNTTVTVLILASNKVCDEGAVLISEVLGANRTLVKIGLSANGIGDIGALALAAALRENTTLKGLDLTDNYITDLGVASLADSLKTNKSLTNLSLSRNRCCNDGAMAMADALACNSSLVKLNLCVNIIDRRGGIALLEASRDYNDTLLELNLIFNLGISTVLQQVIDGMLISRRVLLFLLNRLNQQLEERLIPHSIRAVHLYSSDQDLNYRPKAAINAKFIFHLELEQLRNCPKAAGNAGFIYHLVRTAASKNARCRWSAK